jgi:biopolymer transport protein ExbD
MPIQFRCPGCQQKLSVASRKAGRDVNCPACGGSVRVPLLTADSAAREPAAEGSVIPTSTEHSEPAPAVASRPFIGLPALEAGDDDDAGGISLRKRGGESDEMDLTPMVDVTFLLLIFFMITAAFSLTKTIEVPPPDPEQQGAQQTQTLDDLEKNSIMVRIDAQNAIFVEDEPVGDPEGLANVLADRRRADDKHELILQADAQALHETVVQVLDAANEVQFTRIRLAALPDSDE